MKLSIVVSVPQNSGLNEISPNEKIIDYNKRELIQQEINCNKKVNAKTVPK